MRFGAIANSVWGGGLWGDRVNSNSKISKGRKALEYKAKSVIVAVPYDRVSDHGRTLYKHIGSWSDRQIKNLSIRYFKIRSAHILHNFPRYAPGAVCAGGDWSDLDEIRGKWRWGRGVKNYFVVIRKNKPNLEAAISRCWAMWFCPTRSRGS